MDFIYVARDKDLTQTFLNTVVNIAVLYNGAKFVTS
jgi:hypothetical protein